MRTGSNEDDIVKSWDLESFRGPGICYDLCFPPIPQVLLFYEISKESESWETRSVLSPQTTSFHCEFSDSRTTMISGGFFLFFFPCFFLSCSRASSIWLSSGDNSRLTYIVSPQLHSFPSLTTSPLTFPGHWFNSDWDTISIHQLTICCSFLFSFCVTYFTTTQTQI